MENNIVSYDSFNAFVEAHKNDVFRLWKYKKMFTPYEMENKFIDESIYEDTTCSFVIFREVIDLGNDILIGYTEVFGEEDEFDFKTASISYAKLSEILISRYPDDNDAFFNSES